jgi:hypothetical protein
MPKVRKWARENPQRAGMIGLLLVAAIGWLIVQRVFSKPLGGSCKNDMDCGSFNCLESVVFGYAGSGGVCTKGCSGDSDCPTDFQCKKLELVFAHEHEKVSADAKKETRQLCMKR